MQKATSLLLLLFLALVVLLPGQAARAGEEGMAEPDTRGAEALLCRYGVNYASSLPGDDPTAYDLTALRSGWYVDYAARMDPWGPVTTTYGRVIRLYDDRVHDDYDYSPDAATIASVVQANPGGVWFIGNEPDRPDRKVAGQDDTRPHIYARAYHELYYLLKGLDPTARVYAGTIVQATPIRLAYLDLVLASYREQFGEAMPVDGWSIHGFILREVDCDWDDSACWGADVPPGVNVNYGEILEIEDNDNVDLYIERIERFRRWMRDNGYRDRPLSMSEYGVLMPAEFGFTVERVNAFMDATFNYMRTATSPEVGYPRDGNRLVQTWSWYSVADVDGFNGWLYDPDSKALSAMGLNYADYTAAIEGTVDLYPLEIRVVPATPFSPAGPVTATVQAVIANSGNLAAPTEPVNVRFYDGDPAQGASQIGATQTVALSGCGNYAVVEVTWPNLAPGITRAYVTVEAAAGEVAVANNTLSHSLLVATDRSFLPVTFAP